MTIFSTISEKVIRPPRCHHYNCTTRSSVVSTIGFLCDRYDSRIKTLDGNVLHGVHYIPRSANISSPTIVFLHGYGSNYSRSTFLLDHTVQHNMCLFAFDFSGSGYSEGNVVSFGVREQNDIKTVVNYLTAQGVSSIVLWGFSMGASAAIMYAAQNPKPPTLKGLVLDAPYGSIERVFEELARHKLYIMKPFSVLIARFLVRQIGKKIECPGTMSLLKANPMNLILDICRDLPAYFIHGTCDTIVPLSEAEKLFHFYPSRNKAMITLHKEVHSSHRDSMIVEIVFSFVMKICLKST